METQLEKLATEALKLSANERAAFAQLLLASLDEDEGIDSAWAIEVERRIAELDDGTVEAVPVAVALAQVRSRLP